MGPLLRGCAGVLNAQPLPRPEGSIVARVRARLVPGGRVTIVEASRVRELLERLGASPETHVAMRDGAPLHPDEKLREGEEIVVVRVLSGG